jgi:hypothetical protein
MLHFICRSLIPCLEESIWGQVSQFCFIERSPQYAPTKLWDVDATIQYAGRLQKVDYGIIFTYKEYVNFTYNLTG